MKKHIAVFSFICLFFISAASMAQTAAIHTAETSYDQASLDNALKAKTFEFTLKNLTEADVKKMEKNAEPYAKIFSTSITAASSGHTFKISFKNDVQMKMAYRFFIANSISEVIYKGEKVKAEAFFKQWM